MERTGSTRSAPKGDAKGAASGKRRKTDLLFTGIIGTFARPKAQVVE